MLFDNKYKWFLMLSVLCGVLIVYFYRFKVDVELEVKKSQVVFSGETTNVSQSSLEKLNAVKVVEKKTITPMKIQDNKNAILEKWQLERGYAVLLSNSRGDEYRSYDIATLEQLADSGDGFAVDALANASVIKGFNEVAKVYKKAAVKGSIEALYLTGLYAYEFTKRSALDTEKRHGIVSALTWYNVAALRGDRSFNLQSSNSLLSELKVPLTEKEKDNIKSNSQEIYDDLQQQRTALGLGDFDNSVPPEVKAYYDDIEANTNGLYKR
jgi:hypothetical protein